MPKGTCSIEDCGKPYLARGFCAGHYRRWRLGKDLLGPMRGPRGLCSIDGCDRAHGDPLKTDLLFGVHWTVRFWLKVDQTAGVEGCWPWLASRREFGYGQFNVGGRRLRPAHRLMWGLAYGPIPDGLHVLHHCDNPPCCNPNHLWLGTNDDNVADMVAKGRNVLPPHRKGEANGRSKLTDLQRVEIARRYRQGGVSQSQLAREFGVGQTRISGIVRASEG